MPLFGKRVLHARVQVGCYSFDVCVWLHYLSQLCYASSHAGCGLNVEYRVGHYYQYVSKSLG